MEKSVKDKITSLADRLKLRVFEGDRSLWTMLFVLVFVSIITFLSSGGKMVFNYNQGTFSTSLFYHIFKLIAALVIVFIVSKIPIKFYCNSKFMLILLCSLTVGLIVAAFQNRVGAGTGRKLDLGIFAFQITEFAKPALIMIAAFITSKITNILESKRYFIILIVAISIPLLIVLKANFSTFALILVAGISPVLLGSKLNIKYIWITIAIIIAALLFSYFVGPKLPENLGRFNTIESRVDSFLAEDTRDPETADMTQRDYAMIAVVRAPMISWMNKSMVANYLSEAESDFVFAILVETFGLLAGLLCIGLFITIFFLAYRIANNSPDRFSALLILGYGSFYTTQAMAHMMVSVGLAPVTGQPLPFISYGGSSILFTAGVFGIMQRVSIESKKRLEDGK